MTVSKIRYLCPPIVFGNAFCCVAYGLLSTMNANAKEGQWIGYQILGGIGRGLSIQMVRA